MKINEVKELIREMFEVETYMHQDGFDMVLEILMKEALELESAATENKKYYEAVGAVGKINATIDEMCGGAQDETKVEIQPTELTITIHIDADDVNKAIEEEIMRQVKPQLNRINIMSGTNKKETIKAYTIGSNEPYVEFNKEEEY